MGCDSDERVGAPSAAHAAQMRTSAEVCCAATEQETTTCAHQYVGLDEGGSAEAVLIFTPREVPQVRLWVWERKRLQRITPPEMQQRLSFLLLAASLAPCALAWQLGGAAAVAPHTARQTHGAALTIAMAEEESSDPLAMVKQAGLAGIVSYFCVEVSFFAIALPIGYFVWHESTGEWLQPLLLLKDSSNEDKARLVSLILGYIVLLKTLFPLRLGTTLLLTPRMRSLFDRLGVANQAEP